MYLLGIITKIIMRGEHLTHLTQNHKFIIQSTFSTIINIKREIRCQVYMAGKINIIALWVPCTVTAGYQYFGGIYCLHLQTEERLGIFLFVLFNNKKFWDELADSLTTKLLLALVNTVIPGSESPTFLWHDRDNTQNDASKMYSLWSVYWAVA
jgi:hypothetical protein